MDKFIFALALVLGFVAVTWMGATFIGTNTMAFMVVAIIGGAYSIGVIELLQFRRATEILKKAINMSPDGLTSLDPWIDTIHPSLQNPVRMRVQGIQAGLPGPVLTPYLTGLLVMLGLLGTFVGMVFTLKGAVNAIEGTTQLAAIRAGLAAPIKGLGMAFGTSVAGVAASAMLGLMSTLSRRGRILATRLLDKQIATVFRHFSLIHNQQETFKALQIQTQALPDVAAKLSSMAEKIEQLGDRLGDTLTDNQKMFHDSAQIIYSELATSVASTLNQNLTQSLQLTGDVIKPIVQNMLADVTLETKNMHTQLARASKDLLAQLSEKFSDTSAQLTEELKSGIKDHSRTNDELVGQMKNSFVSFKDQFEQVTASMIESMNQKTETWISHQQENDHQRFELWIDSLEKAQQKSFGQLADISKTFAGQIEQTHSMQAKVLNDTTQAFKSQASAMALQWQQAGEKVLLDQRQMSDTIKKMTSTLTDTLQTTVTRVQNRVDHLLESSGALIDNRIDTEKNWLDSFEKRMNLLNENLTVQLNAIRDDEQQRGQEALERLKNLETVFASHLKNLTDQIQDPMTRLIQTASQAPLAAAQVIEQLRKEVTRNIEQDNQLLEERKQIMQQLDTLSTSLALTSAEQQEAIIQLVDSSKSMLEQVGQEFTTAVGSRVDNISTITDNFACSAVEMASLGDAFSAAVNLFNESNMNMMTHLARIEESLNNVHSRSDEQLGYYVAQAREIIDHSMLSQKQIFEELQELRRKDNFKSKAN